ncbi:hypothetical protein ALC60_14403 [Trachymyrmex zeteki]|uniref:Uncharacterized protein n=1 Tax=Mycetomoellerius zeteki TaxID=64791 RepID=A0A151WFN9_9HYME|nr:hypothetical protein ALC60_14403 [Trachymyrmex zeteki]
MTNGNKYNSPVEIGTATNSENTRQFIKKETLRKIKSIGGHVGLLITLMLYTAIGGLVFRQIELPAELRRLERLRARLRMQRYRFVETVSNSTDVFNLHTLVSVELRAYEEAVQEGGEGGESAS